MRGAKPLQPVWKYVDPLKRRGSCTGLKMDIKVIMHSLVVFGADDSIFSHSSLQILKLSHIQLLANTFVITTVALPMRFCDVQGKFHLMKFFVVLI